MKFNNKKGFTLIELLAVIVILAIIMVIATIQVNKIIKNSRYKANEINKRQIKKAVRTCLIDKNNKVECHSVGRLIDNGYLDDFSDPFDKDNDNIDSSYFIDIKDEDNISVEYNSNEYSCSNFTKKDKYDVGDIISLCNKDTKKSEDFYVIKDNGTTVDALAKQNVNTKTNRQDKNANDLAFAEMTNENYGYWTDSEGNLLSKYGTKCPANVFDSNSLLYAPLENYKTYLKNTLGKTSVDARLITYEELIGLGCNKSEKTCKSAPAWVYSKGYWTTSADYDSLVWCVSLDGYFVSDVFDGLYGLRPVITISKSDI